MVLKRSSMQFRYCPTFDRHASVMNRFTATADQIMPIGQRFTRRAQHIGTGRGQPDIIVNFVGCQAKAFGHDGLAPPIICALAGRQIKQFARDIGGINPPRIFVLNLIEAAFAAAVAQCLPLRAIKAFNRCLPKGRLGHINGPI